MKTAAASSRSDADVVNWSRHPIVLVGIFIGYVALAQAGFGLAGQAAMDSPFRPASGLALAALIAFGIEAWPAVLAGSVIVALGVTHSPLSSIVMAIGHVLGAVSGAVLINRFANGPQVFRGVRSTLRAVGIIFATACVPAAAIALLGGLQGTGASVFTGAWLGLVTGTLVVAPCVLIVLTMEAREFTHPQWPVVAEGIALFAFEAALFRYLSFLFQPFGITLRPPFVHF